MKKAVKSEVDPRRTFLPMHGKIRSAIGAPVISRTKRDFFASNAPAVSPFSAAV
jgi:hypothetical protein